MPSLNKLNYQKLVPIVASVSLLLLLLFVLLGPFISLYGIKKGIETKDHELLERFVDFPVLQTNISERMRKQAMRALGFEQVQNENLLASFAAQMSEQVINLVVKNTVSPRGLSLLLSGEDLNDLLLKNPAKENGNHSSLEKTATTETVNLEKSYSHLLEKSEFLYLSHKHFVFEFENKQNADKNVQMLFERQGLLWKLTDVIFDKVEQQSH